MRQCQTIILLVLMGSLCVMTPAHITAQDDVAWLFGQINCLRQRLGSPPLTLNVALISAANEHSEDLATHALNDFHVGLDGTTPMMRANSFGFMGSVGENVAAGQTVEDVFNWWLNSPVHYDNMTNEHWKEIGIGVSSGPRGTWYTLDFGATTWAVDPFTASPCTGTDQLAPILMQSSVGSSAPIGLQETATPSPPTPTVSALDEHGYIQHVIQPGETPGRIILMYGYSWGDLPRLMELNDMTEFEATQLDVGDIFLVPPRDGAVVLIPETADGIVLPVVTDTLPVLPTVTATRTPIPPSPTVTPTMTASATYTLSPLIATAVMAELATSTPIPPTPIPTVLAPTVTMFPTETLVPPVAFVATSTPIPSPIEVQDNSSDHTSLLLGIVVVQQVIMFGMIGVWRFNRWRDSL